MKTRNKKQETRNKKQETRYKKQETRKGDMILRYKINLQMICFFLQEKQHKGQTCQKKNTDS